MANDVLTAPSSTYAHFKQNVKFDLGVARLPYYEDYKDAPQNTLVGGSFTTPQPTLSAYATRSMDERLVQLAVFNKGTQAAVILLQAGVPFRRATVELLTGPALDATSGVQFGGAALAKDGHWKPTPATALERVSSGEVKLSIAPGSAALVELH